MTWIMLKKCNIFLPLKKIRLKDAIIGIGSFIFGCVVTLNFVSLGINDKLKEEFLPVGSEPSLKNSNIDTKLFSAINYFIVIVIISGPDNFDQRTAIRGTWGLLGKDFVDVRYYFIVGSDGLPTEKLSKIQNEQIKHNDMFLMSVTDTYKTLSKKVLQAFVWFAKEFYFKYILKCDDDSFVFIPKVVYELQNNLADYKHLYWGYFDGRAHIKQLGKWKETEWFLCDRYLPYALGGGYVLSHSLVVFIKENEHMLGTYLSEDVSVGVWLSPLNITRLHDERFDTEYLSRGCNNSFIVTHKHSPESMRRLYSSITRTGKLCKTQTKTRKSYTYNWKVLPAKCCIPEEVAKPKTNVKTVD